MASDTSATPIFDETLAAAADTTPADAREHFDALPTGSITDFYDEYVAHA